MRYLKYRDDFLNREFKIDENNIADQIRTSSLITEAVSENDIRWGDSLIGRFINSVLRKAKLYTKGSQIPKLVGEFKVELDELLTDLLFREEKDQISNVTARLLLIEIYNVVISNSSLEQKIAQLIGVKPDYNQLVQQSIDSIESIDEKNLPRKSELIEKLKRFKDALIALDVEPEEPKEEDSSDEFYDNTLSLLKSIIGLNDVIINKKVKFNKSKSIKPDVTIKKHNNNTIEPKKNVNQPELVTTESLLGFWDFFNKTNEDTRNKSKIRGVVNKNNTGNKVVQNSNSPQPNSPQPNSPQPNTPQTQPEDTPQTQHPIDNENISKDESNAVVAWNKILIAHRKSNLNKYIQTIKEILNGEKDEVIKFGKQIIINGSSIGKEISFNDLIKEDITFNDPAKSISLISRVLLAFKDETGLVNSMLEAKDFIKEYIKSYNNMVSLYPKLKKPVENQKNKENNDENHKLNSQQEEEFNTYNDSYIVKLYENDNNEINKEDKVRSEWSKEFKEGEEKEWSVKDETISDLKNKSERSENKKVKIDPRSEDPNWKGFIEDHIIKIVNIFGKAYDKYAVDEIPSGRLDGRVSQKTFREYTYIGKTGSRPKWERENNPGYGPWATKFGFDKWQNGIMHILEDGKYRKVLANINFESESERQTGTKQKTPGSGKTLFRFISDMLAYGEDVDFRAKRHRLLTDYFNADISSGDESGSGDGKQKEEKVVDPSQLKWSEDNLLTRGKGPKDWKDKERGAFKKFMRINYKNEKQNTEEIIAYITEVIEEKGNNLVIKFHKGDKTVKKESLISNYMKNLKDKTIGEKKLPKDLSTAEVPIFIGIINNPIITTNGELTFKYIKIDDVPGLDNMDANDISTLKMLKINKVEYLKYIVETDGTQSQVLLNFNKDYLEGGVIKKRPKNDKSYGDIKETLKKAINEGKFNV